MPNHGLALHINPARLLKSGLITTAKGHLLTMVHSLQTLVVTNQSLALLLSPGLLPELWLRSHRHPQARPGSEEQQKIQTALKEWLISLLFLTVLCCSKPSFE
ncbi:Hypothetical predicted protein [Podarcis lilfordi]|uniref:Uncharacterized protein n=1 Tax=Podarcis lilfordi TaxID=74358 RepID=A0AA35KP93_9SAUR|nr:Hypothetical predicted protein [Podarcis lilfordi]